MTPAFVNSVQWHHNVGYARDVCARLFRDGRTPADALRAFGLDANGITSWHVAVDRIAATLSVSTGSRHDQRRAA